MQEKIIHYKPANPNIVLGKNVNRLLRVASYSRVSTDEEEQKTSFETQKNYYTDLIQRKPEWVLAGTYADEGISGASAEKRPGFQNMIRQCKRGRIDLIITKSISRFARNTLDSITYVRMLKAMGIGVIFEKENINTLEGNSEVILTILSSLAQEELNSLSQNVKMGKRMAMKNGKTSYVNIFGFKKGLDNKPVIVKEEGEIVKLIYSLYLDGFSYSKIAQELTSKNIPSYGKTQKWTRNKIDAILNNERYCGDVLLQKTYVTDPITKKVRKNKGELPQYLVENDHEGIVSRETFDMVQAEKSKRNGLRKKSITAKTEIGKYSSKYALSDILICGECLSHYRRVVWTKRDGTKLPTWRCINRLDNGTKYCKSSPSLDEESLQEAITKAINKIRLSKKDLLPVFISELKKEIQSNKSEVNIIAIEDQVKILKNNVMEIIKDSIANNTVSQNENKLKNINDEIKRLNEIIEKSRSSSIVDLQKVSVLEEIVDTDIEDTYDDILTRKLIKLIKVLDEDTIEITFKNGEIYKQQIQSKIKRINKN